MKIRKLLNIAFAGTALTFVACTSEEEQINLPENSQAIEIGTYIQQGTRAVDKTVFAEGDVFTLSATKTTGSYSGTSFSSNFMKEVAVTNSGGEWSYSPLATWPMNSDERISFVAWYPGSEENVNGLAYKHTVSANLAGQTDLLWATVKDAHVYDRNGTAINGNETDASFEATSGNLNLKFAHALSKVQFKIKLDTDYPGVTATLKSFKLSNVHRGGTCTVTNDLTGISWSSLTNTYTFNLLDTEFVISSAPQNVGGAMLLIPENNSDMTIDIEYEYTLTDTENRTVTKSHPFLTFAWEANKSYVYTINLSLELATIDISTTVQERDDDIMSTYNPEQHIAVDLGLPSGLKWACCNVEASSPEMQGSRFAWGETEEGGRSWVSYKWCNGSTESMTKYCTNSEYGIVDNKTVLDLEDDVAHVKWGGSWRMPKKEEFLELRTTCTWTVTTRKSVECCKVTGPNGNSIFLPIIYYWTASLGTKSFNATQFTIYTSGTAGLSENARYQDMYIRPVHD